MSFLSKLRSNTNPGSPSLAIPRKDANGTAQSALDKHLAEFTGPVRIDGSDKFFGFENYSSTCYCNSILQCLYYSQPFRDNVINFPPKPQTNGTENGSPARKKNALLARPPPSQPGPLAANSPARRPIILAGTPQAQGQKVDEKDSPEWRKKILMQNVPMLDMQLSYSDMYGMQESLFTALKDIFEAIIANDGRTGIISPHKFLEILRKENEMFRSAMHQDAHEFLNLLLNQVVDTVEWYSKHQLEQNPMNGIKGHEINGMAAPTSITQAATGWVHDLFEGLLVSETRCLTCETTSQRDEAFMDLSVDLDAHSSVTSCLRKFSEEEMLCERNKFHCDTCGGLQEAEKRMKIKRLPRILALHLKRFKYTEDYGRLQKLFHRVVYPFHLRLFNTTEDAQDQDRLYELYAVVVHIGGGPYHGHYVSIIKTQDRGWVLFDDELVEPVDKSYVQNFFGGEAKPGTQDAKQLACAYVLFYQETTLEAVEREQAAEAAAAAASAARAAETAAQPASPIVQQTGMWGKGFNSLHQMTTPTEEKDDSFAHLSHAMTAPASFIPSLSTVPDNAPLPGTSVPLSTGMPAAPVKNKKDIKREEKQAKQDRKAAEKEAEKASRQRAKEAIEQRRDRVKKAEADLQAAIEASKASKAEEDSRLATSLTNNTVNTQSTEGGDAIPESTSAPLRHAATENGSSGIGSRFRTGSLSLRTKKPFWAAGRKSSAGQDEASAPLPSLRDESLPQDEHAVDDTSRSPVLSRWTSRKDEGEKDVKRNRFSMSRKKPVVG